MATVKGKKAEKAEKEYTYDEYAKKFRPKSLSEEKEDTAEYPIIRPPFPSLDHMVHDGSQNCSKSDKHK
jgi:hypothetical protein